ncbi:phosphoglycolate phosphatase [Deefgea piscis]|nr:phosphoglycolate phosphatase [Deefgea piscis]
MSIIACAFDLDGTLVDSIHDLARAANLARADAGLSPLESDRVASFVGDGAASLVARVLADSHDAEYTGSDIQREGMLSFNAHYLAGLHIATRFYPKVLATLHLLRERQVPLALVTNKPERFTLPLLRELGIDTHFDVVVAGDTVSNKKPSADPLLYAASRLNVPTSQLLMVGDSINDVLSARAAGCPVLAVSYGYGSDVESLNADAVIHSFADLCEFLDLA